MTTPALLTRLRAAPDASAANASDEARDVPTGPLMIVVGGVPGAGKSTLLAQVATDVSGSVVIDPDRYRRRIAARLPSWVPYGTYRWAPHTLHAVVSLARIVRGPRSATPILVHDTATRPLRREALGRLARARGWSPVLVAVDVSLADALDGQLDRGRVVQPHEFVQHWERWTAQRSLLATADGGPRGPWASVHLLGRPEALRQVRDLAARRPRVVVPATAGTRAVETRAVEPRRPGAPCAA